MSLLNDPEVPIGFGFLLMQNADALLAYSALSGEARSKVLARARNAASKADMQQIVNDLLRAH